MKKFIGRVKEKRIFKESVTSILNSGNHEGSQDTSPRLLLFSGEAGLGKSMLRMNALR